MSYCKSCQAEIEWVKLRNTGKLNPVDKSSYREYRMVFQLTAGAGKRLTLINESGDVMVGYEATPTVDPALVRMVPAFQSHFATCPEKEEWRR